MDEAVVRHCDEGGSGISAAERRNVVLTFCFAFSTAGAYVVGRSVADALFLARVGPASLPWMYLFAACTVGLIAILFLRFAPQRPLRQVVLTVLTLLSIASIILCQLVQQYDDAIPLLVAIYLLAEIRGCLNTIQYGILMNELFAGSPRHRHVAGLLGAAATLAGIVFGAAMAYEVHQIGTVHLLYVVAGLEIMAMIPIVMLPKVEVEETDHRPSESSDVLDRLRVDYEPVVIPSGLTRAIRSRSVRGIGMLVALGVIVATLIEFQWKTSVAASLTTTEDEMTGYFGIFYSTVNLLTGAIQILLTGKILHLFGIRASLLFFPAALLLATLGVLVASFDRVILTAITLAKGCDIVKRSVNEPAIWMLYAPLGKTLRRRAIAFVSGMVKPFAETVAALLIISLTGILSVRDISYVALALLVIWLFVAFGGRRTKQGPKPKIPPSAILSD